MNKEKSPVLVIVCIVILSLFIILPPVFRSLIPNQKKETTSASSQNNKNSIQILMCHKNDYQTMYIASCNVKYINNNIVTNTIKFKKITEESSLETNNKDNKSTITAVDEYELLTKISGVEVISNNDINTIVIDKSISTSNPDNTVLSNYFNDDISLEKKFYETNGYSCSITKG